MKNFKVVLVGNTQVGKTCIVDKLLSNNITENSIPTIGATFGTYISQNKLIKIHIWDTAGQEKFLSITSNYYRNATFGIVVFDVTDFLSFEKINLWINDLISNGPFGIRIILVANKIDLIEKRIVSTQEALNFIKNNPLIMYREVSALTGEGIIELFEEICQINLTIQPVPSIPLQNHIQNKKCC